MACRKEEREAESEKHFISAHIGNAPELDEKNSTSVKTAVEVFLRKYFEQKSERVSSFACFIRSLQR
jgi:hypothetical protein